MEITRNNFKETLPDIEKAIKQCSFISIDCEFTGLKNALTNINAFDSPKQYYEKIVKDCRDFLVIQYGLTLFRYDTDEHAFRHKSYNFYIFRRPIKSNMLDQRFLCQSSSIDFLTGEGFDFNKLFKEGISYLNYSEEDRWRRNLEEQHIKRKDLLKSPDNVRSDVIQIPEEHKEFILDIVNKLEEFLNSKEPQMELPKCNSFLRRLIYQTNEQKFGSKICLESKAVGKDRILFATRFRSQEEKEEKENQTYQEMLNQLDDYVGFSKVIRMIAQTEKLIIGHNLLLDLLHTIDKFVEPLPNNYHEFKECANSFKRILDTKFMASSEPFKDVVSTTVLGPLLDTVLDKPFKLPKCEIEDGSEGYSVTNKKEHEAGFDSFITGLVFIGLQKYLGDQNNLTEDDIFGHMNDSRLLSPYLNKIFLMFLTDSQYINLTGDDLNVSKDHVFYLSFPSSWTTNHIVELFSPFGGVHVSWISNVSAYVALFKRDQASLAFKTLSQGQGATYNITTFGKRQLQLENPNLNSPNLLQNTMPVMPSPVKRAKPVQQQQAKKRKSSSLDGSNISKSKRSIEPIEEENEQSEEEIETPEKKRKTFVECETWE